MAISHLLNFFCEMNAKKQVTVKKIPNENVLKLAKRIKDLRMKKGYTSFERFAYEHNIDRTQMGRYERGEDLRFTNLMRVIQAFGMTPQEFFSEGFDE